MRRSASRSRDFAVPSGMPSISATCGRSCRRSTRAAPRAAARRAARRARRAPLGGEQRGGHLLDVGRGDRAARLALGPAAPGLLAPHVVDRAAVGERAEPGAQAPRVRVERRGPLPEADEDVLAHVLGRARVADDAHREPVDERRVLVVDLAERGVVAGDDRSRTSAPSPRATRWPPGAGGRPTRSR